MPGKVPGAASQGREGTIGPGSKELERRWQTLLCHGDGSLHCPSAGWQLPGPCWHLGAPLPAPQPHTWAPERGHVCVACPCLPHVGVCSQPAPASQHLMVLWVWSVQMG